jgi:hypothetical protein
MIAAEWDALFSSTSSEQDVILLSSRFNMSSIALVYDHATNAF